jgi:hypothetical protein
VLAGWAAGCALLVRAGRGCLRGSSYCLPAVGAPRCAVLQLRLAPVYAFPFTLSAAQAKGVLPVQGDGSAPGADGGAARFKNVVGPDTAMQVWDAYTAKLAAYQQRPAAAGGSGRAARNT